MTDFLYPLIRNFTYHLRPTAHPTPRRALARRVRLKTFLALLLMAVGLVPAAAQQSASICLAVTTVVNGQTTTSCVPISAATPLPVSLTGTATSVLTASTTPTSGFTAGQLVMSNGSVIVPAGNSLLTGTLGVSGALTALSFTANGQAGVSCAAGILTPATTVVTNGIITHC